MITKICQHCKKTFEVHKSRELKAKFCSTACKYENKKLIGKTLKDCTCQLCGKDFKVEKRLLGKFCSEECYHISKRNRENRICVNCGESFTVKKSLDIKCCSYLCRLQYQAENKVDRSFKNTAWYKNLRKDVFDRDGNKCVECSKDSELQIHHIIPVKEKVDHSLSNLITLCKICHQAKHSKGVNNVQ